MKYSKLFGKTVRDAKKDMKLPSHKLLYQGGFVRELSAGRYQFLPLGFRVWRKVLDVMEQELEAIGSQRFSIPMLQPLEIWQKTNRDSAWGDDLMKVKDRRNAEFALSATGEGVVTDLVADSNPSYKDLPIILNQFILKVRDELRARGGLLRAREFVMQDAYSYHVSEEDFMKTYDDFYRAYSRICNRFDLPFYPVIADSGALGGDYCHEFQVPCDNGEDTIVKCDKCDYAANIEKSKFVRDEVNKEEKVKEMEWTKQPWDRAREINDMAEFFGKPKNNMIKSVMYKTPKGKLVIGVVTGDLEVNDVKLANAVGEGELEKATEDDLKGIGAEHGTVHAWGYEKHKNKLIFVADESIVKAKNLCGGYKTKTEDPINVNYGRDFKSDIEADIAEPYEGAKCESCENGKLKLIRTIEFGHIFKYDHFYTKHHNAKFIDKDGEEKYMYMGAYGIGLGRAISVIVEKHHDKKGIMWPISVAPFAVHMISLDEDTIGEKANDLYQNLTNQGIEVLWDDREDASAGVKFNDADLIGVPIRIVISKRSLSRDGVELKLRNEKDHTIVEIDKIVDVIKNKIKLLQKELLPQ